MARPFRFKLETVLTLRKQKEDEHKRIVAARVRELSTVHRRTGDIERQIERETDVVRTNRRTGVLNIQDIARHRHWLTHLQRSLLETQAHMRTIEAKLAQERAELAHVAKQAKAVEKLRERQLNRHQRDEQRRETRGLDEMAVLRFTHVGPSSRTGSAGHRRKQRARLASRTEREIT